MYDHQSETWRFHVSETGEITRGRLYRLDDPDQWRYYWGGCEVVGFYDEGYRGIRPLDTGYLSGSDMDKDVRRAIYAYVAEQRGSGGALDRVAQRLGCENSRFIKVALDRGIDLWVMMWDASDPDDVETYREEIESVWHGYVYQIETQTYNVYPEEAQWVEEGDDYDQWYGEDKAREWFEHEFPLDAFPAERMIVSDQ